MSRPSRGPGAPTSSSSAPRRPRADLVTVEQLHLVAIPARQLRALAKSLDLMLTRGDVDEAVLLPGGFDPAGVERRPDRVVVLVAQLDEAAHLAGPARLPVLEPMRERRVEETAVAAARAPAAAVALEQEDVLVWRREQRRPQAREAASDDRQVAAGLALERRQRLGRVRRIEPEDALLRVGEGRVVSPSDGRTLTPWTVTASGSVSSHL